MTGLTPMPNEIEGESQMPDARVKHPMIAALVAGIVLAVGLAAAIPALAQCVPNPFVPAQDWLQAQEDAGGHTIARHVGKTNRNLIDRYNDNPQISGASSFASVLSATQFVQAALAIRRIAYNAWEANANIGDRRVYTTNLGAPVGRGVAHVARPATLADVQNQTQVRTVMVKSGLGACFLLTSFPTP